MAPGGGTRGCNATDPPVPALVFVSGDAGRDWEPSRFHRGLLEVLQHGLHIIEIGIEIAIEVAGEQAVVIINVFYRS
jgi:hypothetical protein